MKLNLWSGGESRRGWIRLGNDMPGATRCVPESKNNRYNASIHRHGGVCGVGMLRSMIETSREILRDAETNKTVRATCVTSPLPLGKGVLVCEEVGVVHSSEDALVMSSGAKEPYLVDVNREVRRQLLNIAVYKRRCDG